MKNTCIKSLSIEHGENIIEYYESLGINTYGYNGDVVGNFYGDCTNVDARHSN